MVTEGQRIRAEQEGYEYLVPVLGHIANVALVEVFRLKYRPHTKATAAWYAMMQQITAEYISYYRAITNYSAAETA
jgi:hypothetical protein